MARRSWGDEELGTNEHASFGDFVWYSSPRDPKTGKLLLQSNAHNRNVGQLIHWDKGKPNLQVRGASRGLDFLNPSLYNKMNRKLYADAYASLRSKLYDGNASLGVTAAFMRQSREMIVKRSSIISMQATELATTTFKGLTPRQIANLHLEVIFGWKPLLQDIWRATTSVIQKADRYHFVKTQRSTPFNVNTLPKVWSSSINSGYSAVGEMSVGLAARVRVRNPNTWLAERAGLLNPGAVAWDLVPWSFVVNMFVNTSQLVNSVTDFVGLDFGSPIKVTKFRGVYEYQVGWDERFGGRSSSSWVNNQKYQQPTSFVTPGVVLKLPDVNWELAATASSLAAQRATSVIRGARSAWRYRHLYTE